MNDQKLETLILASRPHKAGMYSDFTKATMQKIHHHATFSHTIRTTNTPTKWSVFMKYVSTHKALAIAMAVISISLISFSGYAYANGTNPYSLLKRWVTGEEVNVMYEGREFKHGKSRTYSDAAVTAFAELLTIDKLAWQAANAYMIPKDGVEHVSNPYSHEYVYPWIGTVEGIDGDKLVIHQQYITGDKVTKSQEVDKQLTISKEDITTYIEGEPAAIDKMAGKLVVVYTSDYMRYRTGSNKTPQPVTHQFAFTLNHTLDNVKEANQDSGPKPDQTADMHGIYEASWNGALSNLCNNNAANHCDPQLFMSDKGQSFFRCVTDYSQPGTPCNGNANTPASNPDAIRFGEAAPDDAARSSGLIMRHVEGKVTTITDSSISVKTSSDQIWTLALTAQQREDFNKRTGSALKIGDRVGAAVISSVNDLDNRTFDNQHIYAMKRY